MLIESWFDGITTCQWPSREVYVWLPRNISEMCLLRHGRASSELRCSIELNWIFNWHQIYLIFFLDCQPQSIWNIHFVNSPLLLFGISFVEYIKIVSLIVGNHAQFCIWRQIYHVTKRLVSVKGNQLSFSDLTPYSIWIVFVYWDCQQEVSNIFGHFSALHCMLH